MTATFPSQRADLAPRHLLVTGGAGFIGANFVQYWCKHYPHDRVVVLDALTYAGHRTNLAEVEQHAGFKFILGNVCDRALVLQLLRTEAIDWLVHFAAESHVDRSIGQPDAFIQTNILGTFTLLEAFRDYWRDGQGNRGWAERPVSPRFIHISTDEVYGSLAPQAAPCSETMAYAPNSPYAASKASSDHLVRAYGQTYGLPSLISHASNNYGPYQHPEKLIPLICTRILQGKPLPVYGDGQQIRDWLYVEDHCRALDALIHLGKTGETYNIGTQRIDTQGVGTQGEVKNLDLVHILCDLMDQQVPDLPVVPSRSLITLVPDRPGHDRRYAIDATKIITSLGWHPQETLTTGLQKTVQWYVTHRQWWQAL